MKKLGLFRKLELEKLLYKWYLPYFFIIPCISWFVFVRTVPIAQSLFYYSFYQWDFLTPPKYVGLMNFKEIFNSELFRTALINTCYYALGYVGLGLPLALILALLINRMFKPLKVSLQTMYFFPTIVSSVAIAIVWRWIFDPNFGLLNWIILDILGLRAFVPTPKWIFDFNTVIPSIVLMSVWNTVGSNMVIFVAGLQTIPEVYYETAKVDGAGRWLTFRSITLPSIRFTTTFIMVMMTIGAFQVFDQIYVMTEGGPGTSSYTLTFLIYQSAFRFLRVGEAAAVSLVLLSIVVALSIIQLKCTRQL